MSRRLRGIALVAVLLAACKDDVEEIRRATRAEGREGVPVQAVGGGADPHTGRPVGYPPDVPLVDGAESLSGGVEPGMLSTASVRYEMPRTAYLSKLVEALGNEGFRVTDEGLGPTGARRLRARRGDRAVSFLVHDDGASTRVDLLSIEPRTPQSGTSAPHP